MGYSVKQDERNKEIYAMRKQGKSSLDISVAFRVDTATVTRAIARERAREMSAEAYVSLTKKKALIIEGFDEGKSKAQIAHELSVDPQLVYRTLLGADRIKKGSKSSVVSEPRRDSDEPVNGWRPSSVKAAHLAVHEALFAHKKAA